MVSWGPRTPPPLRPFLLCLCLSQGPPLHSHLGPRPGDLPGPAFLGQDSPLQSGLGAARRCPHQTARPWKAGQLLIETGLPDPAVTWACSGILGGHRKGAQVEKEQRGTTRTSYNAQHRERGQRGRKVSVWACPQSTQAGLHPSPPSSHRDPPPSLLGALPSTASPAWGRGSPGCTHSSNSCSAT